VIYGQPDELSTRPLHFFDRTVTILPLRPVDNPGPQPAKLLIESANPYKLRTLQIVKRKFAGTRAPTWRKDIPFPGTERFSRIHGLAPLQPH